MTLINNAPVILALQWLIAKLAGDFLTKLVDERVGTAALNQNIIRRNTGLTGVGPFPPYDTSRSGGDIGIGVYHTRAFAPQLKSNRRQVLSRCGHNYFTHGFTAGIKDMIKGQRE